MQAPERPKPVPFGATQKMYSLTLKILANVIQKSIDSCSYRMNEIQSKL